MAGWIPLIDVAEVIKEHHPAEFVLNIKAVGRRSGNVIFYPRGTEGQVIWCSCTHQPHGDIDSWAVEYTDEHLMDMMMARARESADE